MGCSKTKGIPPLPDFDTCSESDSLEAVWVFSIKGEFLLRNNQVYARIIDVKEDKGQVHLTLENNSNNRFLNGQISTATLVVK